MNRTIKETLTKLTLEVHLDWTKLLPVVLLRIRALPRKPLGLSPSEVRYGRPMLPPRLPPNLLPFQASYTPLCWRNSAMPSGDSSTTICLPLPPKPPCPLYKLGTWSVCLIIPRETQPQSSRDHSKSSSLPQLQLNSKRSPPGYTSLV